MKKAANESYMYTSRSSYVALWLGLAGGQLDRTNIIEGPFGEISTTGKCAFGLICSSRFLVNTGIRFHI